MSQKINEVLILGTGPAGLTAAIYTSRANLSPVVYEGPLAGGQLTTTTEVENFPGFAEGVMGYDLMDQMKKQALRFGAEIRTGLATKVDLKSRPIKVEFEDKTELANTLIIATGAKPRLLGLDKEKELMGYGLSTCATCDGAFFRDQEIVVVGGGDSACEEAIFLTKFGKRVRLVHRRDELRASKIMADRVKSHPKIEVLWNSKPIELLGDRASGGLKGAILEDTTSGKKTEITCDAIFYAIGHIPNTSIFEGQLEMDENKYLLTKPDSTQTNIEGVFVCGDAQDHVFRQAITAAGTGCMAAIEAERFLSEHS